MEINITRFFNESAPMDYSASVAEIGQDAGRATWRAAVDDSSDWPMLSTEEQLSAFRQYIAEFGAWDREEIAAWSPDHCNALFIQMVSGDMRDYCDDVDSWDWDEYEKLSESGQISGRLFRSDEGDVYYYVGS